MKKADEYYREKEVCWVKLKGDPWWPGMINKIINRNQKIVYEIIYLGEKEKIIVGKAFVKKWKENYNLYTIYFNYSQFFIKHFIKNNFYIQIDRIKQNLIQKKK